MNVSRVIDSKALISELITNNGVVDQHATVQGDIVLDGRNFKLPCVSLVDVVFTGTLAIRNFEGHQMYFRFSQSSFLGGLSVNGNTGLTIGIKECNAHYIDIWHCQFERA